MKPIDPKDKPKLFIMIGVGAVVVSVVGYEIFTMMGPPPHPAAATQPATAKKDGKNATVAANTDKTPQSSAAAAMDAALAVEPAGGRDPFMPSGSAAPTKKAVVVPGVAAAAPPPHSTLGDLLKPLPNGNTGAIHPAGWHMTPGTMTTVAILPPPPVPTISVTGVVLGEPGVDDPVAIIHGGDTKGEERRYLTIGDYVGNGYRIVAVYADGIDIEEKTGRRRVTIRLGQTGEDSRATK
jgi:hypothetical protein